MATSRLCSIPDCGKSHWARGWCSAHYYRWQRHGNPLADKPFKALAGEVQRYFREVVMTYEGDECHIWPYQRNDHGYAVVAVDGRPRQACRVICKEVNGSPPTPEHQAAHSCGHGMQGCVTKLHLSWKTPKANTADKVIHGTAQRGESHGMARLSADQVREIRATAGSDKRKLAARFGVSAKHIEKIKSGRAWAHVKD